MFLIRGEMSRNVVWNAGTRVVGRVILHSVTIFQLIVGQFSCENCFKGMDCFKLDREISVWYRFSCNFVEKI